MQIDSGCRHQKDPDPFGAGIFLPPASRSQRSVAAEHLFIFSAEKKINANR